MSARSSIADPQRSRHSERRRVRGTSGTPSAAFAWTGRTRDLAWALALALVASCAGSTSRSPDAGSVDADLEAGASDGSADGAPGPPASIDCVADRSACDRGGCALLLDPNCTVKSRSSLRIDTVPALVRMPAAPGLDPSCAATCTETSYAINVVIALADPERARRDLVVRAPSPWRVALSHEGYAIHLCDDIRPGSTSCGIPADLPPRDCVTTYGAQFASVSIGTSDPSAPSADIVIDLVPDGVNKADACKR